MRNFAFILATMFAFTGTALAQSETDLPDTKPLTESETTSPELMEMDQPAMSDPMDSSHEVPLTDTIPREPATDTLPETAPTELIEPLVDGPNHSALTKSDVIDTLSVDPKFSVLTDAIEKAGLTQTLQGEGPFTVFAPTNAGFEALPADKLQFLLEPENKDMLSKVLTYHVVPGTIDATTLLDNIETDGGSYSLETINGGLLTAIMTEGDVYLIDTANRVAKIDGTGTVASNGIIHLVNAALLPSLDQD